MSAPPPRDGADLPLVLGPQEIIDYPLKKATRGYATNDVDDLLDQLASQTKELIETVAAMRVEREQLREQLAAASETEQTLKRTLVTAQRAAEASIVEAQEQAEHLRRRATERAEALLARAADQAHELRDAAMRRARADEADARRHRRDVEEHIDMLRTFADDHRARLRHHLEQQLARLDAMDLPALPPAPERSVDEVLAEQPFEAVSVEDLAADLGPEPAVPAPGVPPPPPPPAVDADMSGSLFDPSGPRG